MKDLIITIAILIILLGGLIAIIFNTEVEPTNTNLINTIETEPKEEIITVTDKWIKRTEDRDLYMIGTENEVFKIEDNGFLLKFNSSDIYNKIKIRT